MKKSTLISLTLVPVVMGYLLNLTLLIPGLGTLLYYLIPCITFVFWFYLGSKYSKTSWNIVQSAIIGNGIGFLCLVLYFWQFWLNGDSTRILFFSALSQDFVASTNFLTAKYVLLFETAKNTLSLTSATAIQILGLLLMVIIFIAGFVFGKVKSRENHAGTV